MKQSENREVMHKRAEELARSGKYENWMDIELALKGEGFTKARLWLDDRLIRSELTKLCSQARARPE